MEDKGTFLCSYQQAPIKSNKEIKGKKDMPALPADAEERDLKLVEELVKVLDQEYGTKFPGTFAHGSERLAFCVKYLWKVFGYSFYGGVRCDDERLLSLKCYQYVPVKASDIPRESFAEKEALEFEANYVTFAESIISQGPQPMQDPKQDGALLEEIELYNNENTTKIQRGFECNLCGKGFKTAEFVHKHIHNRHEDDVQQVVHRRYFRKQARDAYLNDKSQVEASYGSNIVNNSTTTQPPAHKKPMAPRRPEGEEETPQEKRKYVDYDDPMSMQLRESKKLQAPTIAQKTDPMQINYDDLF